MIAEISTALLVIITAIYAYLTRRMTQASEESVRAVTAQAEALTRPYVSVGSYIRPHTNILYLRVKNTGRTAAQNVRLSLDRDFFQFANAPDPNKNLRNIAAFAHVIDSMPPDFELHFALAQGPHLYGPAANLAVTPTQFSITAEYEFLGKRISEVDLTPFLVPSRARVRG